MEERTGWRGLNESQTGGEEKRNGRLVGAAETSKEREEWRRLQRKNLSILGKEKSGLSDTERAVGKYAAAALVKKRRNRAVSPKHQITKEERIKVGESRILVRVRGIRAGAWIGKSSLHGEERQVSRRKGRASKESLPGTSRRKHERVSGRKSSPGRSAESWFHSKSGQT